MFIQKLIYIAVPTINVDQQRDSLEQILNEGYSPKHNEGLNHAS